jgi:hypothetical protein
MENGGRPAVGNDQLRALIGQLESVGEWFSVPHNAAMWGDQPTIDRTPFRACAALRQYLAEREARKEDV